MNKIKMQDWIDYLESRVGMPYLWGGNGESLEEIITKYSLGKQSQASTDKMIKQMKDNVLLPNIYFQDCSGLGAAFLLKNKVINSDMTASGLYSMCKNIDSTNRKCGDFAFLKNDSGIYHVGYIVQNDMIIHAYNQQKGVIKELCTKRSDWIYARPDIYQDDIPDIVVGSTVTITKPVVGYNSAADAVANKNPKTTYQPGTYYVYKIYGQSVNISKSRTSAGSWVVLD